MPLIFIDEDAEFLRWKEDNPNAFIVNTPRKPTASYLMVHRATCGHLKWESEPHIHWTKDYIKVGGQSIDELARWARDYVAPQAALQPCSSCKPT